MFARLQALSGGGFFARAARGAAVTATGYAASQALRLAANLVLTRLLMPEAFGLMALVSVLQIGLAMFSDVGLGPSISQHRRGDDPDFLDTAWTIQMIRGVLLWLGTCALAWPAAQLYNAPQLLLLLPVAGLSQIILGIVPTRIETANRHLLLGRVTMLDLASQVLGAVAMVVLALITRSVWSLVFGAVIGAVAKLVLMTVFLPGRANRLRWEPLAAQELIRFGKWIFLSTACGFLLAQGDKAILGAFLPLHDLGLYNIGFFLASFPMFLVAAVLGRILIPLYRERPPRASAQNFRRLRWMRVGASATVLSLLTLLGLYGVPLVGWLYPDTFAGAGAIVVLVACVQMPGVLGMTYEHSALAAGDSRGVFLCMAAKAVLQSTALLLGASVGGMAGALAAQGASTAIYHLPVILLARKHGAWDAAHDAVFAVGVAAAGWAVLSANWQAVTGLAGW